MMKSLAISFLLGLGVSQAAAQDLKIQTSAGGASATLSTDVSRFAGAINSFTWNGKEFVNSRDHGRLMQSAVVVDGLAGCYNPTEAGSSTDGTGRVSSSKVLSADVKGKTLSTSVDAAFWLPPGAPEPRGCGTRSDLHAAVNTRVVGGYIISKTAQFGAMGFKNVVDWNVKFTVPDDHESIVFEALTGYLAPDFLSIYEVRKGEVQFLTDRRPVHSEVYGPVILSTEDKSYAMGVVCKSHTGGQKLSYKFWNYDASIGASQWDCSYAQNKVVRGEYLFDVYVVFGTLAQVSDTLTAITHKLGYE